MIQNNIAELLKKNGMTQKELAEELNTTEASISRYVSGGRVPKGPMCIQMAAALNCKVEDLYSVKTGAESMLDNNVEPMTPEEVERFKAIFFKLPLEVSTKKDTEVEKALNEIARELKQIRHCLERRR